MLKKKKSLCMKKELNSKKENLDSTRNSKFNNALLNITIMFPREKSFQIKKVICTIKSPNVIDLIIRDFPGLRGDEHQ